MSSHDWVERPNGTHRCARCGAQRRVLFTLAIKPDDGGARVVLYRVPRVDGRHWSTRPPRCEVSS